MNIGQVFRNLVGDLNVSGAKSLELKAGQVVRGVVMQMMSEQEAMVNIAGVPVRARLETPLAQGQATLLQVQPESASGQIILKPLQSSGVQIADSSLPDLLKDFGMKDSTANRRALQELHQGQVPLTRENAKAFTDMAVRVPAGTDEGQWREAAMLAIRRGLPPTPETVGSLQRLLFGKPLSQGLQELGVLLDGLLAARDGGEGLTPATRQAAGQFRQLLDQLPQVVRPLMGEGAESPAAKPAGSGFAAAAGPAAGGPATPQAAAAQSGGPSAPPQAGRSLPFAAAAPAASSSAPADTGAPGTAGAGRDTSGPLAAGQTNPAGGRPEASALAAGTRAAAHSESTPLVGRLLKALGVEHELQLVRPQGTGSEGAVTGMDKPGQESLKGLLLTLSTAEDASAAVREGARQLVQQIAGQQLLMLPDQSTMFTHTTLMLPLFNQNGSQTAAIHIQSRKGSRGELDASNCHLVFDLSMQAMGPAIVDVQVTDKIVGLRVYNDFPVLQQLLESHRDDVKSGLESIGYQLLTLRAMPYPEPEQVGAGKVGAEVSSVSEASQASQAMRAAGRYQAKPYRGMDVRV